MFPILPFHCHSDKWALQSLNNFPLNLLCKVYNTLTVKLSWFIFYEFLGIAWFFLYFRMCQKRWGSRDSGRSCLIPALAAVLESGTFYQTHFWNLAGGGRVPAGGYSQMHGPWLLLPAERMSTGSGLEADQPPEHSTMAKVVSHPQRGQTTAKSGIPVCSWPCGCCPRSKLLTLAE